MFIAEMTIKDVPPFSGEVDFKFDKRVNVFIGPNASGKSTLLQQMLDNYRREWAYGNLDNTSEPKLSIPNVQPFHLTSSEHFVFALEDQDADDHRNLRYDVIIVPATRVRYGVAPQKDAPITDNEDHDFFGVESLPEALYQDHIHSTISALQRIIQGNPVEDDAVPEDREHADHQLLHPFVVGAAEEDPQKAGRGLNQAISVAYSCAKEICREVIQGNAPLNEQVVNEVESESGLAALDARLELGLRVRTSDRAVPSLNVAALSAGTEGTLWWTRLIALSLLFMHEFEPGWQKRRAILLIDEIENHLHPTWQRRVIPALLEHFPGLQIFATTHSPFVVAGLKAGQVHLLNRDENGVVTASANTENIEGWTADEILRVFMGVDEPTDETTAQAAQRLRRLRDEGARADEREENERQSEITRLRQIVDRAALSGPRAAEDARFLADLEAILERYKESQDLNQENG